MKGAGIRNQGTGAKGTQGTQRTKGTQEAPSVVTRQRVKDFRQNRYSPIRGMTPEKLSRQRDAFKAGYLREFALTMDAIEEFDDVIKCVAGKRKAAVARREYQVLTPKDLPRGLAREAAKHKEALEYFYRNLKVTNAIDEDEEGGFELLVRQMMDAVGKRYAVHEIIWDPRPEGLTAKLRFVPLWFFENREGRLKFLPQDYAQDGVELKERDWLVTVGPGIMMACATSWLYKMLPLRDWLIYSQNFGTPGVQGKTPAAKGSQEWNDMVEAVSEAISGMSCVTGMADIIEKLDFTAAGAQPFQPLVESEDRKIVALWRGNDLGTLSADAKGASVQADEGYLMEGDDASMISGTLQMKLDSWIIQYVFGEGVQPLAYTKIILAPVKDTAQDIAIDNHLISHGAPVGKKDSLERYGRALPDADEELMEAVAPAAKGTGGRGQEAGNPAMANEDGQQDDSELIQAALADGLGVRKKWLAPLDKVIREIIAALEDDSKSDEEILAMMERAANSMPALAGELDVRALADSFEKALGASVLEGVREAIDESATAEDAKSAEMGGTHV